MRNCGIMDGTTMDKGTDMGTLRAPLQGRELISLAQKLARDAERHAILSASLASQADRLMVAGLQALEPRTSTLNDRGLQGR